MSDDVSLFERTLRPLVNNEAGTGSSGWYPELEPRRYAVPVDAVLEAVRAVIAERERWSVADVDPDEGRVEYEVRTEQMGYVDDVTVRVDSDGEETVVHARSQSRFGFADFGQNARTVRELLDRLDRRVEGGDGRTSREVVRAECGRDASGTEASGE